MTPRSPRPPAAAPRLRGERGSASLELAVVFPVVLLLVFTIVQAGIYFHARTLAITAAQEGLRAASTVTGAADEGQDQAASFLTRAADGWITNPTINAQRTPTTATVTVTGRAISLLPGVPGLPIHQEATGPVERPTG